jgi:high-affinity nickel permease
LPTQELVWIEPQLNDSQVHKVAFIEGLGDPDLTGPISLLTASTTSSKNRSRGAGILVSPVIDGALQELVDQVSMASMYFNGIEACMHII